MTNQNDDNLVYIQVKITDLTKLFKDKIEVLEKKVKDLPNLKKMHEYHSQIKNFENKISKVDFKKVEENQLQNSENKIDLLIDEKLKQKINNSVDLDPSTAKIRNSIQQIEQNTEKKLSMIHSSLLIRQS